MYKTFFGLTRNPFEISPDPYFLFATARHNEALASIVHGVLRHKGFIVVTGEVGTGKTLLVRCLLELLRQRNIASANVFNPCLSPLEFLRYIVGDFGIKTANQDKGSLLLELNNYLIARHRKNTTTVLIVDEAQHLEPELLEEIRLLTNLETSQQKLLQIVLVGQPELDQKMDSARPAATETADCSALSTGTSAGRRNEELHHTALAAGGCELACQQRCSQPETMASVYRYSKGIPAIDQHGL